MKVAIAPWCPRIQAQFEGSVSEILVRSHGEDMLATHQTVCDNDIL